MAEDLTADEQAVAEAAIRWLSRNADISAEVDRRWLLGDEELRQMLRDCLAALDLPARDARVTADLATTTADRLLLEAQARIGGSAGVVDGLRLASDIARGYGPHVSFAEHDAAVRADERAKVRAELLDLADRRYHPAGQMHALMREIANRIAPAQDQTEEGT